MKSPTLTSMTLLYIKNLSSTPSYLPQINMAPCSLDKSFANAWSNFIPLGDRYILGPSSAEADDKALSRTSAFITIPGPPPNGTSSTLPFLLFAKSLILILLRFHKPFSRALPANEQPKVPGNISGNNVRTVAFHTKNSSC